MQDPAPRARGRFPGRALLAGALLLTVCASWQAAQLEVETGLADALPRTPAAEDYRRFLSRFGGVEKIFVLVTAAEGSRATSDALTGAAERLATLLRASEAIRDVRSGIDSADEAFFVEELIPRAILFADLEERVALRRRLEPAAVRERVRWIKSRLAAPTSLWEKPLLVADPLGLSQAMDWRAAGAEDFVDPTSGAFLSPDGTAALLIVTPEATEIDANAGQRLQRLLDRAYSTTSEETDAPLAFHAVGGPLYAAQDERILRRDLTATVTTSALGVALLLFLYFGSLREPVTLAVAIATGVIWTAAVMALAWGSITVIGLAFTSILLGLGVDYGIHGSVRFGFWTARGSDGPTAVRRAISDTGPAIRASAWTTAAAFLVLVTAELTPLRELGRAVAIGIAAMAGASLAVGAPLLVCWPAARGGPRREPSWLARRVDRLVRRSSSALEGKERPTVVVAVLLTAAAIAGATRIETEGTLESFRPHDHPARKTEKLLTERFGVGVDTLTIVLEAEDLDAALEKGRSITRLVREAIGGAGAVTSPTDWLGSERETREAIEPWSGEDLAAAVDVFERSASEAGLSISAFERPLGILRRVGAGEAPEAVPETSWPDWLSAMIQRSPQGYALAIRVRAPRGGLPLESTEALQRRIAAAAPEAAVASIVLVGEELRRSVLSELRRLGAWCGLAIAVGVLVSFRGRWLDSALATLPVGLGFVWLLGVCGWSGLPIDPFSAMMAPLILGIGIDDGLHALHGRARYGGLRRSIVAAAPAMAMTTLTTCVGFGSLLASSIPALRRGGSLVALGTLLCLLATLFVLPAVARLARGTE